MTELARLRAVVDLARAGLTVRDIAQALRVHERAVRALLERSQPTEQAR
ncbi:MAG TPA: helix-turn-helix domain-containing protein [Gammaproteobacteria bacterium]